MDIVLFLPASRVNTAIAVAASVAAAVEDRYTVIVSLRDDRDAASCNNFSSISLGKRKNVNVHI